MEKEKTHAENNMANPQVDVKEGVGGGAPNVGAEVLLQATVRTKIQQTVFPVIHEVHGGDAAFTCSP